MKFRELLKDKLVPSVLDLLLTWFIFNVILKALVLLHPTVNGVAEIIFAIILGWALRHFVDVKFPVIRYYTTIR